MQLWFLKRLVWLGTLCYKSEVPFIFNIGTWLFFGKPFHLNTNVLILENAVGHSLRKSRHE